MVTKSTRSARRLFVLAVAMFGFAFALVPLYDVFCEVTGINGKTDNQAAASSVGIDTERVVTVEFVAYTSPGMRWTFEPQINRIQVHPGETHTIHYLATNNARYDTIGQAVPSVSPGLAAQYFNKIECFCFNRQPLPRGEDASLPLIFYVDPELPDDINHLTLAYTLFDVTASVEE
ncbi:cytochrome c oxidase assembly protein [Salinivibrio socompensis]|uniref:cytochrome c oxidase assembly protein n=1 Tax=Salinivibrio socompensis TaxID=1510206 RepID=UPI0004728CA5|nr:cytochrome c oxidase assembly protein [Salinivibrio socompensis]